MAKVLFVAQRLEQIVDQWRRSGCATTHTLVPLEAFISLDRTRQLITTFKPDIVCVAYNLGRCGITGADVCRFLRQEEYRGYIVANSSSSAEQFRRAGVIVDGVVSRRGNNLKRVIQRLIRRTVINMTQENLV